MTQLTAIVDDVIRIVVADDHPSVRTGVEAFLGAEPGLAVAAAVATAAEAETVCRQTRPDVLVADYHLPDRDGLSLCLRLERAGGPPVVLFSAFADDALAVLAMVAGATAMVPKSADPWTLVAAVHAVAAGERVPPWAAASALHAAAERLDPDDLPVLGMLANGVPPPEIASTLGMREEWLAARRWAMFERLRGGGRRRSAPRGGSRRASVA